MLYPARLGITARGQAHFLEKADASAWLDTNENAFRQARRPAAEEN